MASEAITPALQYLTDAAHLMRAAAPTTSARLMSQRGHLMTQHDMSPSPVQKQLSCGACGTIFVPGTNSTISIEGGHPGKKTRRSQRVTKSQQQRRPAPAEPKTVICCSRCDKKTRINIGARPVAQRPKKRKAEAIPTAAGASSAAAGAAKGPSASSPAPADTAKSANASSKKRAKNRKTGLQALLAGQKQKTSSPLSLGSFMKK